MRLLFVHGGEKIIEDKDGNLYTGGSYNKEVWDRYLSVFEDVSFIARKEPNIVESNYAKQKFQYFDKNRIKFIEVPNLVSSYKNFLNINKRNENISKIKKAVLENDCLIARLPSGAGYTAIKYARKYNKPYLVEVVGCVWDALWNHSYKGKLLALSRYFHMKKLVKHASYAVYVTNEFLQRRYPTNGHNTNCSNVLLTEFDNKVLDRRLSRIKSMKNTDKIVIGTTAAVNVRYKGQQYVIKALGKLKKEGINNFEYQLIGDGDQTYLKEVAEKHDVSDQVKFLGSVPHNKVFEWLETIDLYAQPSRQEGLPRALIEAMSYGLPAFGARTAGIPELLEPEFIFSNTRKNIDEICNILKSFSRETRLKQAERNYEDSKKYDKNVIEERRRQFFMEFKETGKSNCAKLI